MGGFHIFCVIREWLGRRRGVGGRFLYIVPDFILYSFFRYNSMQEHFLGGYDCFVGISFACAIVFCRFDCWWTRFHAQAGILFVANVDIASAEDCNPGNFATGERGLWFCLGIQVFLVVPTNPKAFNFMREFGILQHFSKAELKYDTAYLPYFLLVLLLWFSSVLGVKLYSFKGGIMVHECFAERPLKNHEHIRRILLSG